MTNTYRVEIGKIEEHIVPDKRLGRHIWRDSRSAAYPIQTAGVPIAAQLWARHIPILNQGNVGACVPNATTGALGTDPIWPALPVNHPVLDETFALVMYNQDENMDGDGPYPPNDNGSYGLTGCKVAKNDGYTSGYLNAANLLAIQAALQTGPVIIGINWYSSFDNPASSSGLITISPGASVRGGHELVLRGVDPVKQQFFGDNSWGAGWGNAGSFLIRFSDMTRLLSEGGDCYQPLPLNVPVPTPVPPAPVPDTNVDDIALATASRQWVTQLHTGGNAKEAKAVAAWMKAKGFV